MQIMRNHVSKQKFNGPRLARLKKTLAWARKNGLDPALCETIWLNVIIFSFNSVSNRKKGDTIYYYSWVVGPVFALLNLCIFFFVPWHNGLMEPDYWYEFMMQLTIAMWPIWAASIICQCSFWGNFKSLQNWPTYIFCWCIVAGVNATVTCSFHVLWTQYYSYYSPMPFTGYVCGLTAGVCTYIALYWR